MAAGASELQKAVDKLLKREPRWKEAIRPPDKGAKAGGTGVGRPSSGTAVIELIEDDASTRQYHETPHVLRSSDGIITIEVEPIKQINLRGGIPFQLAEPPDESA